MFWELFYKVELRLYIVIASYAIMVNLLPLVARAHHWRLLASGGELRELPLSARMSLENVLSLYREISHAKRTSDPDPFRHI